MTNVLLSMLTVFLWTLGAYGSPAAQQAATAAEAPAQRGFLDQYCVGCHNQAFNNAGVILDTADVADVSRNASLWERVVRQMRASAMPPMNLPRPDKATYDGFRSWVEDELDKAAAADPNPGTTVDYHRLNRREYQNAVRDLLALDIDATSFLPEDSLSYGFDNIGGIINVTGPLLESYIRAARSISRTAVGVSAVSEMTTYELGEDQSQDIRFEGLPFGSRGGTTVRHYFPVDGEYDFTVRLVRERGPNAAGVSGPDDVYQLEVRVDGVRVYQGTVQQIAEGGGYGGNDGVGALDPDMTGLGTEFDFRLPIEAGPHTIAATFRARPAVLAEGLQPIPQRPAYSAGWTRDRPYISSVTVIGPQVVSEVSDSPSRQRIFLCHPAADASEAEEVACARRIVETLARRAFRGLVATEDLEELLAFYSDGRSKGSFDHGIQLALERILVSPQFLFRIASPPPMAQGGAARNYRIPELQLASQLSFFLWSSIPDDELLDLAIAGRLREPGVLEQQVRRMLADPRAETLTKDFAGQWLQLRDVANINPDPIKFTQADKFLRDSLRRETELLFDAIRLEDRSILTLLNADFTFVNEPVAKLYGIPNVYGPRMRRITRDGDDPRAGIGILGHGSILMLTSYPNRTSPVLRGKWVIESLLGVAPPPPPPSVPELELEEATVGGTRNLSMREAMELHRSNAGCAGCHARMDPIGFALENFDAIGRWREEEVEAGQPIDATGELIDGTQFAGPHGLRDVLMSNAPQFVATAVEKLMTYGLGRGLEYYDMPSVRKIVRDSEPTGYRFSSLVLGVVESLPFQMRRISELAQQ